MLFLDGGERWILEPLILVAPRRMDGRGVPSETSRDVLNGVLWVLHTGSLRRDLPERYQSPHQTRRRFQRWIEEGVLDEVLRALAEDLKKRGGLDLSGCFVDATFVGAKRGRGGGKDQAGQGYEAHGAGLLGFLSPRTARASPYEVTLVGETPKASFVEGKPERMIGDRAYDSDPLEAELREEGRELPRLRATRVHSHLAKILVRWLPSQRLVGSGVRSRAVCE